MARIRTVKPEFWSSPDLPPDPWARLLYVAMWNWADDEGRGTANARELMGFAFPNEDWMTLGGFRQLLGGVRRAFGVKFYTVGGRPYFEIPSWENHQKIDKRSKSRIPASDAGSEYDPDPEPGSDQQECESSESPPESPPSPPRVLGGVRALELGTGEQGKEPPPTPPSAKGGRRRQVSDAPDEFPVTDEMRFWARGKNITTDLAFETDKWLAHHRAHGSRFKSWDQAWQKWMLNTLTYGTRTPQVDRSRSRAVWDQ